MDPTAPAPAPRNATFHGIDVGRVEAAIGAAEATTSAELRVSIARFYFWGNPRRAAERVFHRLHMERTRRRNGVLIFVVPRRRRFEILCDVGITPQVPAACWEEIAAGLTADFRAGERTRGLERAIAAAARKLAEIFPPEPAGEDVNELPNQIVPEGDLVSAMTHHLNAKVDVAINVYGKPRQTAVALLSLLRCSGTWIDKIWFITERRQPFGARFDELTRALGDKVIVHTPLFWLGVKPVHSRWRYRIGAFRRSVRYQYAWESSRQPFLYITHNDVLYRGDIIGAMLERIDDHVAAGPVGQCWNCPAKAADVCGPTRFMDYRPSHAELMTLTRTFPAARARDYGRVVDPGRPWPLPECRVNEWAALINLRAARPLTMPFGPAVPFGAFFGLDTGARWFHDVLNAGQTVAHFDIAPYARHGWTSEGRGGHAALADRAEYERSEAQATDHLRAEFSSEMRLTTSPPP